MKISVSEKEIIQALEKQLQETFTSAQIKSVEWKVFRKPRSIAGMIEFEITNRPQQPTLDLPEPEEVKPQKTGSGLFNR